jgi:4-carboxymuconolactone decarboxylase
MGEYLRYRSSLGLRLSELAILVTARHWSQQVEWAIHAPIAEREGISPAVIQAISEGRRPEFSVDDEQVVYDFSSELHHNKSVSDVTWEQAIRQFGEQGAVDLIGINGYYAFLSMVMNASGTPLLPPPCGHCDAFLETDFLLTA